MKPGARAAAAGAKSAPWRLHHITESFLKLMLYQSVAVFVGVGMVAVKVSVSSAGLETTCKEK
ncbi:MAG: hypothetical protein OEL57_00075 [Trichlorobacter sp.]|uniref:hypothetical protein n=1 Tax=Trichlorobacter sp. TaxID=2911007 RepID=UPI00256A5E32|nr:hypothetical protein [Trichlorobacter sp.]MDK9716285.1 hypothetical protein [Trichlorobacter sp.]